MTILKYLARKNKVADNWYPKDLKLEAKVNQYLDWHHTGIRKSGIDIFVGMVCISGSSTNVSSTAKSQFVDCKP